MSRSVHTQGPPIFPIFTRTSALGLVRFSVGKK